MAALIRTSGGNLRDLGVTRVLTDSEAQELAVEITAELIGEENDFGNPNVDTLEQQNGLIKWLDGDDKVLRGLDLGGSVDGAKKRGDSE
jgi:hypothetical protein